MVGPHVALVVEALVRDPGPQLAPLTVGPGTKEAGVGYDAAVVLALAGALGPMGGGHGGVRLSTRVATKFCLRNVDAAPWAGQLKLPPTAVAAVKLLRGLLTLPGDGSAYASPWYLLRLGTLGHLSPSQRFARTIPASAPPTGTAFLSGMVLDRLAPTRRITIHCFGLQVLPLAPAAVAATVGAGVARLLFHSASVLRACSIRCRADSGPLLHPPAATSHRASAPDAPPCPCADTGFLPAGFAVGFPARSARLAKAGSCPLPEARAAGDSAAAPCVPLTPQAVASLT